MKVSQIAAKNMLNQAKRNSTQVITLLLQLSFPPTMLRSDQSIEHLIDRQDKLTCLAAYEQSGGNIHWKTNPITHRRDALLSLWRTCVREQYNREILWNAMFLYDSLANDTIPMAEEFSWSTAVKWGCLAVAVKLQRNYHNHAHLLNSRTIASRESANDAGMAATSDTLVNTFQRTTRSKKRSASNEAAQIQWSFGQVTLEHPFVEEGDAKTSMQECRRYETMIFLHLNIYKKPLLIHSPYYWIKQCVLRLARQDATVIQDKARVMMCLATADQLLYQEALLDDGTIPLFRTIAGVAFLFTYEQWDIVSEVCIGIVRSQVDYLRNVLRSRLSSRLYEQTFRVDTLAESRITQEQPYKRSGNLQAFQHDEAYLPSVPDTIYPVITVSLPDKKRFKK